MAKSKKKEKHRRVNLRIYLLKLKGSFKSQAKRDVVLDVEKSESIISLTATAGSGLNRFQAALFIRERQKHKPDWLPFLQQGFDKVENHFSLNRPNSAVLIVHVGNAYFGIPYGYGRSMIRADKIVRGFGLRTVLSIVDPASITSVDAKTVDCTTLFTSIQSNRRVPIHEFAMDLERDMLRGAYGFPEKCNELCSKALGSDALYINPRTDFDGLGAVLQECRRTYGAEKYKTNFDFVDQIRPVSDVAIVERLDAKLVDAIQKQSSSVSMGAPTPIRRADTAGFRFSRGRPRDEIVDEVDLAAYVKRFTDASKISLDKLKKDRVIRIGLDSEVELEKWSVYRWMAFDTTYRGKSYLLQDGDYYEVAQDFRDKVDRDVKKIRRSALKYPTWDKSVHAKEDAYNEYLRGENRPAVLLDKECATDFEGRSKLEVCDVLGLNGGRLTFVHVKKYDGSSVLSHLFSQGAVSAQAMLEDSRLRTEVRGLLPTRYRARVRVTGLDASKVTVVYAMAFERPGKKAATALMPFFSKLNLRQRAHALRRMGVECQIAIIEYVVTGDGE